MKIHICMVSDQPLVNILPALVPEIKPDKIYLLTSAEQKEKGNGAAQTLILKNQGIPKIESIALKDAFDFEGIKNAVQKIIDLHPNDHLMLNATGGTKPMAIAAYDQCFNDNIIEVFYLHNNQIIWLNTLEDNRTTLPIKDSLPVKDFLSAHNIEIKTQSNHKIPESRQQLAKDWANRAQKHTGLYSLLNAYASKASNTLKFTIEEKHQKSDLDNLCYEMEKERLLTQDGNKITFTNEESRFFANGGWLEEHLFNTLLKLKETHPQITSVARSVDVIFNNSHLKKIVKNELDVIAIINNKMWVFECKTKRMQQQYSDQKENDAQHMIYKLAGIMKELGGLRTSGCVVSFNDISNHDKSRAELFNIQTIDGNNLKNLLSLLKNMLMPN